MKNPNLGKWIWCNIRLQVIRQEYSASLLLSLFDLEQAQKTPIGAEIPASFSFENQNWIKYFWYFVTFCINLFYLTDQTSLPSLKIWPMAININYCEFWGLICAIDTELGPWILSKYWNKIKQKYTSFIRKKIMELNFGLL